MSFQIQKIPAVLLMNCEILLLLLLRDLILNLCYFNPSSCEQQKPAIFPLYIIIIYLHKYIY